MMFSLLAQLAGSFDFEAMRTATASLSHGQKASIFLLAMFGFRMKAGFFPLHVWLPEALHPAPSRVSAVMLFSRFRNWSA